MSAITVVKVKNGKLKLYEQRLKNILLHPRARKKPVVVISITGALRQGKTTMLNFIKRFLDNEGKNGWIGPEDQPLRGFLAQQGSKPVTEGIVMWSEPYLWNLGGESVAVFIVDSQGSFEIGLNNETNSALFVLSSLLSSIQIFNVMDMINQRDFEHLTLFSQYATAISRASEEIEAFQKLSILIRDWRSPGNITYGTTELALYTEKSGTTHESQEWKEIKNEFEKVFSSTSCCLLPHPGDKVAIYQEGEPKSEFYIDDFNKDFISHMKKFVEGLLEPKVVKKVGGVKIISEKLFELFKEYYKVLQSGKISPPEGILKAAAKDGYYQALHKAIKYYKSQMKDYSATAGFWVTKKGVEMKAKEAKFEAGQIFGDTPKISCEELSNEYQKKLYNEFDDTDTESLSHASTIQTARTITVASIGAGLGLATGGICGPLTGMSILETAVYALSTGAAGSSGVVAGVQSVINMKSETSKKKQI